MGQLVESPIVLLSHGYIVLEHRDNHFSYQVVGQAVPDSGG